MFSDSHRPRFFYIVLASVLLCFTGTTIYAQEQDFFDIVEIDDVPDGPSTNSKLDYRGYVQQKLKYGTDTPDQNFPFERDQRGISQFRTDFFAEIRYQFNDSFQVQISGKNELDWIEWNREQPRESEQTWGADKNTFRLKDAFLDLTFSNDIWLRIGNQVLAWGESESLAVTDILSTQDLREPGQAELQDIREQIPAALISAPVLQGTLNTVLTWSAGADRFANSRDEFYPLIALKNSGTEIETHSPDTKWELAFKYDYRINGGDLSFVAAEINKNTPDLVPTLTPTNPGQTSAFQFSQRRQRFFGASANRAINSFLFRAELGRLRDTSQNNDVTFSHQEDQYRGMVGAEYSGWNNWTISMEYNFIHHRSNEDVRQNSTDSGYIFRSQYTALNEKLSNQFWFMKLAEEGGRIARWDLSYELRDNWELSTTLVNYENDNEASTLYPFRNNDTVNIAIKYGF